MRRHTLPFAQRTCRWTGLPGQTGPQALQALRMNRHSDATPQRLMQWAIKTIDARAVSSYYCCSDGESNGSELTAHCDCGAPSSFPSLLAAVCEPLERQLDTTITTTAIPRHTTRKHAAGKPSAPQSDVDGNRTSDANEETAAALRKLLHECVRITPAVSAGEGGTGWLRIPMALVRLCLHPHPALRSWAMEEVLRLVERPDATASVDTRVSSVWYVAAVFIVLVECLAQYLAVAPLLAQADSVDEAAQRRPSSTASKTERWLANLLTDGLLFVQALQRIVKEAPATLVPPPSPDSATNAQQPALPPLPSSGSIEALPLVAGNLLVEALFVGTKRCITATAPVGEAVEVALVVERRVAECITQPTAPFLQHYRFTGGGGSAATTTTTLDAQLAMTWIHCVLVDCRAVGRALAGGGDPATATAVDTSSGGSGGSQWVLQHAWERLRWVWRVTSWMAPFQRNNSSSNVAAGAGNGVTSGRQQPQSGSVTASTATNVLFANLRDSVLKLSVGNLLKQHQIGSLVTEGNALLPMAAALPPPASSEPAAAASSAATLGHWKQRASTCALVVSTLIASYLHSDHRHRHSHNTHNRCQSDASSLPSSIGSATLLPLLPSPPSVVASLAYHTVVVDNCQGRSITSLLQLMHSVGVSTAVASRASLLAPHILLYQLVSVDVCAAFRAHHPSTIANAAVWKLAPQLFRQALAVKRDVEGALRVCHALMLPITHQHHCGVVGNAGSNSMPLSLMDQHLLFLASSVAATRPPVAALLAECVHEINAALDTPDTIELVAQYIAAVLRNNSRTTHAAVSSTSNACDAHAKHALCPMLSSDPTHDLGLNLVSGIGLAAWRLLCAADPKLRRLGETLARRVFGHAAVVALAPAVQRPTTTSTFVARDYWRADAARFMWRLIASQSLVREALPRACSMHGLRSGYDGGNGDADAEDGDDAHDSLPLARLYGGAATAQCVGAGSASLAQCPTVGPRISPNVLPLARSQMTSWLETFACLCPTLNAMHRRDGAHRADAGEGDDDDVTISIPWAMNVVLEVLTGANATSQQRRTFLSEGLLRLYDASSCPMSSLGSSSSASTTLPQREDNNNASDAGPSKSCAPHLPGAVSADDEEATWLASIRRKQRNVIGCATLYQLLAKASLFETTPLLSCIIAIGKSMDPDNAAYLVGLTQVPGSKHGKKQGASAASTTPPPFVPTVAEMGLPSLKQWHVALHGLWQQLPATDRNVLKATAHQSFPFFKALLDSMKNAVQDVERQRESAFAQFEREDAVEKVRDEMQRQAEVSQAAVLAENRRKDAQERNELAARRRIAQDEEEATRKRQREKSDDVEAATPWGIKESATAAAPPPPQLTPLVLEGAGGKPTKQHRVETPSSTATNEWAALRIPTAGGGHTKDAPVVVADDDGTFAEQQRMMIPAAYSLVHRPASASTIATAAAAAAASSGDAEATPRVGNLKLMIASERRKALPLSNASKALLAKQLTDVVLQTEAPLGALATASNGTAPPSSSGGGGGRHRSNKNSGGNADVIVGDIVGPTAAALFPHLVPLPTEFDAPKPTTTAAVGQPSSAKEAAVPPLDSSLTSVVTWAHMKPYVDAFAPHLALELRHDVASSIRDFVGCWRRAVTGGGRAGGGKDYLPAAVEAGAFPVDVRRGDAPRSPSSLRANFALQVGGESNHQSVVQFLSDGDVVLLLLPDRKAHHHHGGGGGNATAGGGGTSFNPTHHFHAVVAAVNDISFADRTVSLMVAGYADATIRVLNALLSRHSATAAPTSGGGGGRDQKASVCRPVDFYVVRLGTQLSQYVLMANALHDVLFTPARDTLLQPQLAAAELSQKFLQAAAKAVPACEGGRMPAGTSSPSTDAFSDPCPAATLQRHRLTASLNEFQRAAVHAALYGYFDRPTEGGATSCMPGGQFVIIQGPPGTGKTQTIHSIVAAVLREGPAYQRVLVCAPSNTAVDEVLLRLKRSGVAGRDGRRMMPTLLRVGIRDSVHPELLADATEAPIFYDDVVTKALKQQQDGGGGGGAEQRVARQKARDAALAQAQVVCVTLGSLRQLQQRGASFDFVIIDEASQATEPQCVLALTLGCKRCVLVGDTKQLQPTILSSQAARAGFGRSLMARLLIASHASVQLRVQYRMVPAISLFANTEFYGGALVDASTVRELPRATSSSLSIPLAASKVPRLLFVDVKRSEMRTAFPSKTLCNPNEAHVLIEQLRHLRSVLGLSVSEYGQRACIITYYKGQQSTLRRLLSDEERRAISVDTVDGFQGKEKDIVFVSCVRGPKQQNTEDDDDDRSIRFRGGAVDDCSDIARLGFVADPNRMNVSLTRAKEYLMVVGHGATLLSAKGPWARFVAYAAQQGDFTAFQTGVDMARGVDLGTNVFASYI